MLGCLTSENSSPKQYIQYCELQKDLMTSPWTYSKFVWSQISLRHACLLKHHDGLLYYWQLCPQVKESGNFIYFLFQFGPKIKIDKIHLKDNLRLHTTLCLFAGSRIIYTLWF